jgi:hypothetical protein
MSDIDKIFKKIVFTKEDWKDFYFTLKAFKKRVVKRHEKEK